MVVVAVIIVIILGDDGGFDGRGVMQDELLGRRTLGDGGRGMRGSEESRSGSGIITKS